MDPQELLRLAADASTARSTLLQLRGLLGPAFGCEQFDALNSDDIAVQKLLADKSVLPT